uniref:DUF2796 domain-containing protein n=1 Tax=Candidatus Kentrum sp. LFY TaxID=2126342 RepID=A0A450UR78_9GAMM|nr:MAG: Protein of unknown function (DUF2796) [Candidatus Kentron sp. LFY]
MFALIASFVAGTGPTEPAHRHGVADLDIVFSGKEIAIELHSPANNILGFEHAPKTHAERERLTESLSRLKQADSLLVFPEPAGCNLESVKIEHPFETGPFESSSEHETGHHGGEHEHDAHHDEGAGHDGDHHESHHEAGHETGHESEHGHEHEHIAHGKKGHETHADISVSYRYHCQQPGRLDGIETQGLFQYFPGFEKLKARWADDRGQSAAKITRENTRIDIGLK